MNFLVEIQQQMKAALKDNLKHCQLPPKKVQQVRRRRGVAEKWITAREEMEDKKWYTSKY